MGRRRYLTFLVLAAALVASYHLLLVPAPPSRYHALFLTLGSNASVVVHLHALTLRPHVVSTEANAAAAEYVRAVLSSFPNRVMPYSVLLSNPIHRSLSLCLSVASSRPATTFPLVQDIELHAPNSSPIYFNTPPHV